MNTVEPTDDYFDVLVVEDNRADVVLLTKAFEEVLATCRLHIAINGGETMSFLNQQPPFASAPRPSLILLDLNLPGRDGCEILEMIKSAESIKRIPVIVLTSSRSEADVRQCYDAQANAFMTKAANFEDLLELVRQITSYWLAAVRLPED